MSSAPSTQTPSITLSTLRSAPTPLVAPEPTVRDIVQSFISCPSPKQPFTGRAILLIAQELPEHARPSIVGVRRVLSELKDKGHLKVVGLTPERADVYEPTEGYTPLVTKAANSQIKQIEDAIKLLTAAGYTITATPKIPHGADQKPTQSAQKQVAGKGK